MERYIKVNDRGTILEISYEDMIKYHGRFNIGGVALAFKALELGLAQLIPGDEIPDRNKIGFVSALGEDATGVVDGVEMATRAATRGMLSTDMDAAKNIDAPANPDGGKFYFEVSYEGKRIGMALKAGLIPQEFTDILQILLTRRLTPAEMTRLQEVKEGIAAQVIAAEAQDLFNLHY